MSVDASLYSLATLTHVGPSDDAAIHAAIELGDRFNATLGFLSTAPYYQAAASGTLLVATVDSAIVGYALYGLARGRVRLTHLCIATEARGRGIARQMVEHISDRHNDSRGIHARCRRDFDLHDMWISLGFSRRSEQAGRAKKGSVLVNWWRDHGHPNLFTRLDDLTLVRATIDLNILRDLTDPLLRGDRRDVLALIDDQIADRLELVRTGALDAELHTIDSDLRARCTDRAQQVLTSARSDSRRSGVARAALIAAAIRTVPGYPRDQSEEYDLRHVADSIAAGVNVFMTRDEQLIKVLGAEAQTHGLRLLRPAEVIAHLDELVRAEEYRPAALLDTGYTRRLLSTGDATALAAMTNPTAGERTKDFTQLVADLVVEHRDRTGIFTPTGQLVAAYSTTSDGGVLRVALARVGDDPLRATLARQLLFAWRQAARAAGASVIVITDRCRSQAIRLASYQDGFDDTGDGLAGFSINAAAPAAEISRLASDAARHLGADTPAPLRSDMPAAAAAELERVWWPAKITDSQLPSYIVSIRQVYSTSLLGTPPSLIPRDDVLGISRELVYYRTPHGRPVAPARVLWYMSQGGTGPLYGGAIIGCSQLDEVVEGSADDLYDRFRHLGVWVPAQITEAARDGIVQALVFSNTEIFDRPIDLQRLRALAAVHRSVPAPQQPTRIPPAYFADIYREGTAP